jgi:hypothetical protein
MATVLSIVGDAPGFEAPPDGHCARCKVTRPDGFQGDRQKL